MIKQSSPNLIQIIVLLLAFAYFGTEAVAMRAESQVQSAYRLRNSVIGAAGYPGTSTNYKAAGTMGQTTPIGIGSSAGKTLRAGFWGKYWIPTAVDETPSLYRDELYQNYPNPFNPVTTIEYSVAKESLVDLTIFDVSGRRIRVLVSEIKSPGNYEVRWDGRNEAGRMTVTGIYFYRLRIGSFVSVRKMLLLK